MPAWLGRVLDSLATEPGRISLHLQAHAPDGTLLRSRKRTIGASHAFKVPVVCAACNNGWMSQLELDVRPHLEPMVRGEVIELDASAQEVVTRWAIKTAFMFDRFHADEPVVPVAVLRRFYEERNPPHSTRVWLAHLAELSDAGLVGYIRASDLTTEASGGVPKGVPNGLVLTLLLAHLVMQVTVVGRPGLSREHRRPMPNDFLRQVWQSRDEVISWPPAKPMDRPSFLTFANADVLDSWGS